MGVASTEDVSMVADIVVSVDVRCRTMGKCAVGQKHELLSEKPLL